MKALCLASIIMLLVSCSTARTAEVESYLDKGYRLQGAEAAEMYIRGIEEEPSSELYYNLAYSYLEEGDFDSAIDTARTASALYPDMIRFDYLILYAYRESGRMYSYEKELERVHRQYPANKDISEMLLKAYSGARRPESIPIARQLLQRDPSNDAAIRALGEFYPFYAAIASEEKRTEPEPWDKGPKEIYNITKTIEDGRLT